ncbi:hypothetical protein [Duganella callida]|uniref:Uncharacterized protein n=1 Tax=Duganella callida TaxID=2561932 RepID=A0A4Y9S046_9BURK|nr:hypothetical protein [Duganella callida]TFW13841.1 hypothetical protein E4L98_28275 [Duganella callida]
MKICLSATPSRHTVKPSKTVFLNNTGHDLTLKFVTAEDLVLSAYTISNAISAAIDRIQLDGGDYYSCQGRNIALPADGAVVLTLAGGVLTMEVSSRAG